MKFRQHPVRLFLLFLCLAACRQQRPLRDTVLTVQNTGQLVTAQYTLSKIVKASDDKTWYKVGNRKILMSLEAEVKAGIDLQGITEKNFRTDDAALTLTLPPAQIFSLSIPPDKIRLEYEEVDLLRHQFSAAEREALLVQAERQIRKLADSLRIVETAEENAALYLRKLLEASGYEKVHINFEGRKKEAGI